MAELKGSKTEQNLKAAFAGESQAHTKYLYYASRAEKDGYQQIGSFFRETALNEKEHAKIWFKLLHGDEVPVTTVNLKDAADGENFEWTDMYAGLQKPRKKKGIPLLRCFLKWSAKLRKNTRNGTANSLQILKAERYLPATASRNGIAATAATL